ncbi:polysaccharide deacetylase family protein [Paenibacillus ehimensis]|uniref:polysaccharide deacetylase family protein n=1 Tax=Paenibacillus ehimensis TaxID=79264 RepID=UPI002DB6C1BB|nr:polysaccharide deacetylase family protein [Paenibacillus ehimensis]MEC0209331.1 polysaccharide deacetylase family protein [Paenibacillus ehimensis]
MTAALAGLLMVQSSVQAEDAPRRGRAYYEQRGGVVWEVPTEEKVIALTFDDGPDPENTGKILDLLKRYEAKATFFLVGNKVERFPGLVKREAAEGHELANHTYNHTYFKRNGSSFKLKQDLHRAEGVIYAASGQKCRLFRPPGGFYSEKLIQMAMNEGYTVAMWSWHQDTRDWDTPGVDKIVNKVLSHARNGDIVLFHDYVEGKSQTVDALKEILPELKKRGYHFVTVSELLSCGRMKPVKKLRTPDIHP